ncbi:MAG: pyruvate kinase [Myxococcota bacterium]
MRRTKIVCTLGPASDDQDAIDRLVRAGMDCARLNFSHGSQDAHAKLASRVRHAAEKARRPVALLADLCGPKMRIGQFRQGPIELVTGQRFVLSTKKDLAGDATRVSVSYEPLARDVRPGDRILIDDGLLRLRVENTTENEVHCVVEVGGPLSDRKGLNLPGAKLSTPALTEKDKHDLEFAVRVLRVDYIALSFVRHPTDVEEARQLADDTPIIAKIEKPEAVENLTAICDAADGLMVARGDLGVEIGSEKVPMIQKRLIRMVNERGKIVITATQMLDSMIRNPRPTRAEAADVANAVLDGTDALMLSGETATGRYPAESVEMMGALALEAEQGWQKDQNQHQSGVRLERGDEWRFPDAAARSATLLAQLLPIAAVVTFTHDGRSANLIAEHRCRAPIVAVTSTTEIANRLALRWGVVPRVEIPPEDLEETLRIATSLLVREGLCQKGDAFAMIVGWPLSARTNTVKLHRV